MLLRHRWPDLPRIHLTVGNPVYHPDVSVRYHPKGKLATDWHRMYMNIVDPPDDDIHYAAISYHGEMLRMRTHHTEFYTTARLMDASPVKYSYDSHLLAFVSKGYRKYLTRREHKRNQRYLDGNNASWNGIMPLDRISPAYSFMILIFILSFIMMIAPLVFYSEFSHNVNATMISLEFIGMFSACTMFVVVFRQLHGSLPLPGQ